MPVNAVALAGEVIGGGIVFLAVHMWVTKLNAKAYNALSELLRLIKPRPL
jgi:hypothetical protein